MPSLEDRYRQAHRTLKRAEDQLELLLAAPKAKTEAGRRHEEKFNRKMIQRKAAKLQALIEERRRELHRIELLMIPAAYNNRDSRRRNARHEVGTR